MLDDEFYFNMKNHFTVLNYNNKLYIFNISIGVALTERSNKFLQMWFE